LNSGTLSDKAACFACHVNQKMRMRRTTLLCASMRPKLDLIEKKYRDTPKKNRKYVKRLSDFIRDLMDKGRIIESKYYFSELMGLKPDNIQTHVLGYKLSIKTFDNHGVSYFDKFLHQQHYNEELLLCLRLQYYYSVNNEIEFSETACYILTKRSLGKESLDTISRLVISQHCYEPIAKLCHYLKRERKHLNKQAENKVKRIALQQLADSLVEIIK